MRQARLQGEVIKYKNDQKAGGRLLCKVRSVSTGRTRRLQAALNSAFFITQRNSYDHLAILKTRTVNGVSEVKKKQYNVFAEKC